MNADVTVREVVDREFVGVSESDSLLDTVELLLEEGTESAVVLRGTNPVGVLSERDVLALLVEGKDPAQASAEDAMSPTVPTIAPDEPLPKAIDRISAESTRHLIVNGEGEEGPLGLLTEHDLLASTTYDTRESEAVQPAPTTANQAGMAREADEATEGFQEQGICEVCGSLSRDLGLFNGQLVCSDCRSM